jgi:hypothetical protein
VTKRRVFTWHVHGHYLYYLTQSRHDFFVPVKPGRPHPFGGRAGTFPWPDNLHEIPMEAVRREKFDCVLFQSRRNYLEDQYHTLTPEQRLLPRVFLEHDAPGDHPTDSKHCVDDPDILLVHVTPYNRLMWDSGRTPTRLIEHGVVLPEEIAYSGEIERGITAVNNLRLRGRMLGADIFEQVRRQVPVDLVGMDAETLGGIGEIKPMGLPAFEAKYRFFFNPIRYTSMPLALCEAMMIGMPVVAIGTTEIAALKGESCGFVGNDVGQLIARMRELLADPKLARELGRNARRYAHRRFDIRRFVRDWETVFEEAIGRRVMPVAAGVKVPT